MPRPDLVADEHDRHARSSSSAAHQIVGRLVDVAAAQHQVGEPQGQAIDQHRLACAAADCQRLVELQRLLDRGPVARRGGRDGP